MTRCWLRLLDAREGELLRDRHRDYFCAAAERMARALRSVDQQLALAAFDAEHDNLQAALDWCANGDAATALQLVSSLRRYWTTRGLATSGRKSLEERLQQAPESAEATSARANALLGARACAIARRHRDTAIDRARAEPRIRAREARQPRVAAG